MMIMVMVMMTTIALMMIILCKVWCCVQQLFVTYIRDLYPGLIKMRERVRSDVFRKI